MMRDYAYPEPLNIGKSSVEAFANQVAQKLGFRPGDDIVKPVKKLGGKIVAGSTGDEDIQSGSMIARSLSDFIIYVSPFTSLERDRFTIAHELGHLLLHLPKVLKAKPDAVMRATRHVDNSDERQRRAEWEANWFAAAFLMPAAEFQIQYNKGVENAQRTFKVSSAAVEARAKSLGLV
jgi:Zn-dependent peptidase ImmA (M78 family)